MATACSGLTDERGKKVTSGSPTETTRAPWPSSPTTWPWCTDSTSPARTTYATGAALTPIPSIILMTVRVVGIARPRARRLPLVRVRPVQTVFTEVPMLRKKITIESIALPM